MDRTADGVIERLRGIKGLAKLVGCSPCFAGAIAQLPAAARSGATVLISGETGTGKELVARALHYLSDRAPFPFVAVNCGALVDTLLEDELFGHERGAFTDAQARRPGLISQAEKGTVFLDEVDALTPRAQVVLLRLLQDRAFRSLGSAREQQADIRFVAATNASLPALVQSRGFRADLYYRLCVFTFSLPPLRERRDDILELAAHFMALHAVVGRQSLSLSSRAAGALLAHDWPGNVRELENSMIRAVGVAAGPSIELEDLGLPVGPDADASGEAPAHGTLTALKRHVVETFERQYLARLLIEHRGNVSNAARAAGRERRDFGRLLRKYQLDRSLFGTPRRAGGS